MSVSGVLPGPVRKSPSGSADTDDAPETSAGSEGTDGKILSKSRDDEKGDVTSEGEVADARPVERIEVEDCARLAASASTSGSGCVDEAMFWRAEFVRERRRMSMSASVGSWARGEELELLRRLV